MNKLLKALKKPSVATMMQEELEENERCLLSEEKQRDYHGKLAEYYAMRIATLRTQLCAHNEGAH